METNDFSLSRATRCPVCDGQGMIRFVRGHHGIEDRPADGRADSWPCPRCGRH